MGKSAFTNSFKFSYQADTHTEALEKSNYSEGQMTNGKLRHFLKMDTVYSPALCMNLTANAI